MRVAEIARVDVKELEERIRRSPRSLEPVVVVAEAWPRWTHAYVLEKLGEEKRALGDEAVGRALVPTLEREIAFLDIARRHPMSKNVWLAPDGYVSHLHYDMPHNLNTVLRGEKEVTLFHPRESRNLYPCSPFAEIGPMNSRVDLDDVDASRFPRVARAPRWQTTVRAGETLYIPPRVWHFVRSHGESVAVNIWFWTEPRTLVRRIADKPAALLLHTIIERAWRNRRRSAPSPSRSI
jgi:hypothetical protein